MKMAFSPIPLTGLPFPREEYERRQQRVLAAVERAGLDALAVTAYGHNQYLSGYDGNGAYFSPFPLILVPGKPPTYIVREYDQNAVRAQSCIDEVVPYTQQGDLPGTWAGVLRRYGVDHGRIGLELGCWNLAPSDVSALQGQLPSIQVVDATRLVASLAAVKTDLELEMMRQSMALTDLAIRTFQEALRDGVTESEVFGAMEAAIRKGKGEFHPSYQVLFGAHTRLPHGKPVDYPLRANQPAFTEVGALKHGYAAGLVRSAVLGRHTGVESLHSLAEEALEAALAVIKPGVTAGEVDAAARGVIKRSGHPEVFRHRAGYQTGINWLERGNISLEPNGEDLLQAGMTFHLPIVLHKEGEYATGCSENIVVTNRGAEILSGTPHTLYRA